MFSHALAKRKKSPQRGRRARSQRLRFENLESRDLLTGELFLMMDDPGTTGVDVLIQDGVAAGVVVPDVGTTTHADPVEDGVVVHFGPVGAFPIAVGFVAGSPALGGELDLSLSVVALGGPGHLTVDALQTGLRPSDDLTGATLSSPIAGLSQGRVEFKEELFSDRLSPSPSTMQSLTGPMFASSATSAPFDLPASATYDLAKSIDIHHTSFGHTGLGAGGIVTTAEIPVDVSSVLHDPAGIFATWGEAVQEASRVAPIAGDAAWEPTEIALLETSAPEAAPLAGADESLVDAGDPADGQQQEDASAASYADALDALLGELDAMDDDAEDAWLV